MKKKRELREWINNAIAEGYDRSDIEELTKARVENGKMDVDTANAIMDMYDDEFVAKEKMKLTFMERRAIKKLIKQLRKINKNAQVYTYKLSNLSRALNKKERRN